MKLLLDTDIGSDIDDCFALAYLLCRSDVELMGITTSTGLPHLRAQLAHTVCATAGVSVPIHVGAEQPLSGTLHQPTLTKAQTAVAESCERTYAPVNTAVDFLRQTIEEHPHEITLVAIGPLTNVGLLFREHPHIPSLLKGLVIMAGRYTEDPAFDTARWGVTEWNILCDSAAAETVFAAAPENTLVIGVEQTCRFCVPPAPLKEALWQIPRLRAVSDAVNTVAEQVYFHDVMALYALLEPKAVTRVQGEITLDLSRCQTHNATRFTPDPAGRFHAVTDLDPRAFFDHYCRTLSLPPL